jgi:adenosylhomocysteine nucleosidase
MLARVLVRLSDHCPSRFVAVATMPFHVPARLLILTALRYEAVAVADALGLSFESRFLATGRLPDGRSIDLHVIGPGAGRLPRAGDVPPCQGVIMAGLAGGLDPLLQAGDVVIDETSPVEAPDPRWRRGPIHSTDRIVATPADKASLFAATRALVVDMENAAARRLAADLNVPFLGIRAVSDRADEPLDPLTLAWTDPSGRLRPARLALDLCRRPQMIPRLWHMRARASFAMRNLADALRQILREGRFPPTPAPDRADEHRDHEVTRDASE